MSIIAAHLGTCEVPKPCLTKQAVIPNSLTSALSIRMPRKADCHLFRSYREQYNYSLRTPHCFVHTKYKGSCYCEQYKMTKKEVGNESAKNKKQIGDTLHSNEQVLSCTILQGAFFIMMNALSR